MSQFRSLTRRMSKLMKRFLFVWKCGCFFFGSFLLVTKMLGYVTQWSSRLRHATLNRQWIVADPNERLFFWPSFFLLAESLQSSGVYNIIHQQRLYDNRDRLLRVIESFCAWDLRQHCPHTEWPADSAANKSGGHNTSWWTCIRERQELTYLVEMFILLQRWITTCT
jgi:hypothetical protein